MFSHPDGGSQYGGSEYEGSQFEDVEDLEDDETTFTQPNPQPSSAQQKRPAQDVASGPNNPRRKVIGVVRELKRAKSYKTVQFPPPDFDKVEKIDRFPRVTNRWILATDRFETASLTTSRFPLATSSFEADSPCSKN
ncbi:uncharacterized protein Pyn_02959 [Prunus yedoensis var. nudiflora]|uniref:Uncharacterized protein n=1 Tax=Prunus yedoensis var. nudiflora TaxID=2094558 RepID=A0A314UEC7_PRUYE|nr:uncharacterized protein Pyn_02959 [Prunus yedoensis var. nudiflora]